jgi:hypothetical protein
MKPKTLSVCKTAHHTSALPFGRTRLNATPNLPSNLPIWAPTLFRPQPQRFEAAANISSQSLANPQPSFIITTTTTTSSIIAIAPSVLPTASPLCLLSPINCLYERLCRPCDDGASEQKEETGPKTGGKTTTRTSTALITIHKTSRY